MKASPRRTPVVRWTPTLKACRALSLKQPWAWLVVNGYKDIENRSWRTNHRGPLLVHASRSLDLLTATVHDEMKQDYGVRLPDEFEFGGIIGVVDVVDCVRNH